MKWNKRLKAVLTKKDSFSEECLETQLTKTAKTQTEVVSSAFVSSYLIDIPEKLNANKKHKLVSSAFVSVHSRDSIKKTDELFELQADKLHAVLNRLVADDITFEISADEFQMIDGAKLLKKSDKEFLKLNGAAILCHLQQSLLVKHLFSDSPVQFEDFAFEITERECLISPLRITDKTRFEIYFEAVKSTTRKWFEDLLNKKT